MRFWLAALALGALFLTACGRQSVPSIDVAVARTLLVAYSRATSDEVALTYTTAKERDFLQGIIDERNAGKHSKATAWRAKADSDVMFLETGPDFAVVQLTYRNSFTAQEEKVKLRLESVKGQWLIANHTDPEGVWWPDYLNR